MGNFDGVHLGHARIIERLVAAARRVGGPAVAFTFDPHPAKLLRPDRCPAPLTWIERRAELLGELGVDAVIAYPTDGALLRLTARQFFESILCDRLDARAIVEGANFRFGHDRLGDVDKLRQLAASTGVVVEVVEPVLDGGEPISSSRVRGLVAAGDVAAARRMLTRPYRIRGTVSRGAGRGAQLGFPTANLEAITTVVPAHGVYAAAAYVGGQASDLGLQASGRGLPASEALGDQPAVPKPAARSPKPVPQRWPAAINLGPNPTFGESETKVEVHLIGFGRSLLGETIEVEFLDRLRDVRRFAGIEELKTQLRQDVRAAEAIAAHCPG